MTDLDYFWRIEMACNVAQRRLDAELTAAIKRVDLAGVLAVSAKYDILLGLIAEIRGALSADEINAGVTA